MSNGLSSPLSIPMIVSQILASLTHLSPVTMYPICPATSFLSFWKAGFTNHTSGVTIVVCEWARYRVSPALISPSVTLM